MTPNAPLGEVQVSRGFFEIGIYRGKDTKNVGTLWRSAYQAERDAMYEVLAALPPSTKEPA